MFVYVFFGISLKSKKQFNLPAAYHKLVDAQCPPMPDTVVVFCVFCRRLWPPPVQGAGLFLALGRSQCSAP